jgi:hypothetical protein
LPRPDLPWPDSAPPSTLIERIEMELREALQALPGNSRGGFVSSELRVVHAALQSVLDQDLARGPVFCEWGSGLGAVCALAAALSYEAYGIEIQAELVQGARDLVEAVGQEAHFALGSFLLPGDESLVVDCGHTSPETSLEAHRELDLSPGACDVVFAYPWPGEEQMHDMVFARRATPGALLLTFHDVSRVLVQRRTEDPDELQVLGWMGAPHS